MPTTWNDAASLKQTTLSQSKFCLKVKHQWGGFVGVGFGVFVGVGKVVGKGEGVLPGVMVAVAVAVADGEAVEPGVGEEIIMVK